jgi:hypothetical protein
MNKSDVLKLYIALQWAHLKADSMYRFSLDAEWFEAIESLVEAKRRYVGACNDAGLDPNNPHVLFPTHQ